MNKWTETGIGSCYLEPGEKKSPHHWTACGKMVFLTPESLWKNRTAEK